MVYVVKRDGCYLPAVAGEPWLPTYKGARRFDDRDTAVAVAALHSIGGAARVVRVVPSRRTVARRALLAAAEAFARRYASQADFGKLQETLNAAADVYGRVAP